MRSASGLWTRPLSVWYVRSPESFTVSLFARRTPPTQSRVQDSAWYCDACMLAFIARAAAVGHLCRSCPDVRCCARVWRVASWIG